MAFVCCKPTNCLMAYEEILFLTILLIKEVIRVKAKIIPIPSKMLNVQFSKYLELFTHRYVK